MSVVSAFPHTKGVSTKGADRYFHLGKGNSRVKEVGEEKEKGWVTAPTRLLSRGTDDG